MKVWRAMSKKEFELFNNGVPIIGRCRFSDKRNGYNLNKGVCFFADANNCAHWGGYVICCFYIPSRFLEKSTGCYPDLNSSDWYSFVECEEYATKEYSKENAVLLAYGFENRKTYKIEMFGSYGIPDQQMYGGYTPCIPTGMTGKNIRRWRQKR